MFDLAFAKTKILTATSTAGSVLSEIGINIMLIQLNLGRWHFDGFGVWNMNLDDNPRVKAADG